MLVTDLSFLLFRGMRLEQIKLIKAEIKRFESIVQRWRNYHKYYDSYRIKPHAFVVPFPVFAMPTITEKDAIKIIGELEDLLEYNQEMLELEDRRRQALIKAVLVVFVICIYACAMWQISAESVIDFMFMGLGFKVI